MRRAEGGRAATIAVLLTALLVALVASRTGSPLAPPLVPETPAPLRGLARLAAIEGLGANAAAGLAAIAMLAAVAAFLLALRAGWRGRISVSAALAVGLTLHVLVLAAPLLLSRDTYSYAIYGRIASVHGANPYVALPAAFPTDPFASLLSRAWLGTPSVYGPFFVAISAGLTRLARTPVATVLAFRLLATAGSLAAMVLVARAARRVRPERAAFAVVLLAWNPLVLFHTVGGGHADALLAAAVASAAVLLLRGRDLLATGVLTLGALIKVSAGVPLLIAVVASVARRRDGDRLRHLAAHAGVIVALTLTFAAPLFDLRAPTLGLAGLAGAEGWAAPFRLIRRGLEALLPSGASAVAGIALGGALLAALVAICVGLVRRGGHVSTDEALAAIGLGTLAMLLSIPILNPWYPTVVLPLVWILPRTARGVVVGTCAMLAVTQFLAEAGAVPGVWTGLVLAVHYLVAPALLVALVWLLISLVRTGGREVPEEAERADDEEPGGPAHREPGTIRADRPQDHRRDAG